MHEQCNCTRRDIQFKNVHSHLQVRFGKRYTSSNGVHADCTVLYVLTCAFGKKSKEANWDAAIDDVQNVDVHVIAAEYRSPQTSPEW